MDASSIATVIPTYNEGERLRAFLTEWATVGLSQPRVAVTAIVVDDGSEAEHGETHRRAVDAAQEILTAAGSPHRIAFVRAERNGGKGSAIRLGWSRAPAEAGWLTFIDADGAIPAREYWRVAGLLPDTDADAVCACRVKMAGRSVDRTLFRHIQGRLFATFVEELFHLGFYDTQTGMKAFRASRLRPLLPDLQETRWLLDVELLVHLRAAGARLVEVPVDCRMHGASSLVFGLDPLRMAAQLVRLRARLRDRLAAKGVSS
jgi:dolichyl-phosphate beta-glucosyltransferase